MQIHMKYITGFHDRDIMLNDVWEYTELDLSFGDKQGTRTTLDGTFYALSFCISCIDSLGEICAS